MADGIEVAKAYVQVFPVAKGFMGALSDEVEPEAEKAGKSSGGHLLASMGKAIVAGAAVVAGAASALVTKSVQEFSEYEQLVGGAQLMFGDAYDFVAERAASAYKNVQMSQNEYLNQVNGFAVGLKASLGGDAEAAAELADKIIVAQADIVAATGKDADSISNAFAGIMRGNFTMLDNLGLGIAGTKEGMAQVVKSVNEWNKANGDATKYQMGNLADMEAALVQYVEMQGLAGYATKEAMGTITGSLSATQAAWSNVLVAMADDNADFDGALDGLIESATAFVGQIIPRIGQALKALPKLVEGVAPIIINELPGLIAELLPQVVTVAISLINAVIAVLPELINTLVPVAIDGLILLVNSLILSIPTLITTLVPAAVDGLLTVINAIIDALPMLVDSVLTALVESVPAIIQGAITLFMGIIQALPVVVDMLLTELPHIIDVLIGFLIDNYPVLIQGTIQLFMALVDAIPVIIKSLIKALPPILTAIWNGLKGLAGMLWNDILQPAIAKVGEWISSLGKKAIEAGKTFLNNVISFFKELPGNIYTWLLNTISKVVTWGKELGGKLLGIGENAVKGLWNGISNVVGWITEKIKGFGNTILGAIKGVLGIHSPSTEFAWIGEQIDLGLAGGITKNADAVADAIDGIATMATGTLTSDVAVMGSYNNAIPAGTAQGAGLGQLINAVNTIAARLDKMQVVLDTGLLVGGITEQMDGALGSLQVQVQRGQLA